MASAKATPCFRRFAAAFLGSQSNLKLLDVQVCTHGKGRRRRLVEGWWGERVGQTHGRKGLISGQYHLEQPCKKIGERRAPSGRRCRLSPFRCGRSPRRERGERREKEGEGKREERVGSREEPEKPSATFPLLLSS